MEEFIILNSDYDYEDDYRGNRYSIASAPQKLFDEGRVEEAKELTSILDGCC